MSKQSSLALRKQMIEDRISNITDSLSIGRDKAFLRYVYATLFRSRYDDPDFDVDVVDGGDDKQFDIIRIEEDLNRATVHLVQVKNSSKYSGTAIVRMRDGLDWVFKKPETKYSQLPNTDLAVKIGQIRDLVGGPFGHRNLEVKVYYVAKGDTTRLSPDFSKEIAETVDGYQGEFGHFEFTAWGINELVNQEYESEESTRKITADLPILWDVNVRSVMEFQSGNIRAALCSIRGDSLARLVAEHNRSIFEENVRTFLGLGRRINKEIVSTACDAEQSTLFWFFNNGITATCDKFDVVYGAKQPFVRVEGIQIVNGCQTSMALLHAFEQGVLSPNVYLLLKVFETQDPNFVDKVTLTTNSQNAVSSRDLRSNDMRQRDLAKLFLQRGYFFERKPKEFNHLGRTERRHVVPNEKAGQAYLAVIQHKPATAMAQKEKIWSDYYNDIFGCRVEELLGAYLLYDYCSRRHKQMQRQGTEGLRRAVAKYGHFHAARLLGSYQLGEDWRIQDAAVIATLIEKIVRTPAALEDDYNKALATLETVVGKLTEDDLSRVVNVFKSGPIEDQLDEQVKQGNSEDSPQRDNTESGQSLN